MKNKRTGKQVVISVVIVVAFVALASMTGTRRVSAATFTVTNTGDNGGVNPAPGAGTGTLRQAIIDANATAGADTINFQAGLTGTITLGSALPQITQDVTINGPGANVMAVSGAVAFQVFNIASGVTVSISGLTISGGRAVSGGGINNGGTLTITNSTVSGNSALVGGAGFGGGIANFGTLTITNSTFSGNSAFEGGAIFNGLGVQNTTLTVTNSTISGNSATGAGGGIDNTDFFGTLFVINTTISGNSGGGFYTNGSSTFVANSIIANSTLGANCGGAITGVHTNYSTDNTCGGGFSLVPSTALNLGPLQDNGGPTFTHALLAPSVAIDAVSVCTDLSAMPAPVTTDQRGKPRPADGDGNGSAICDVGAFEVQPCSLTCPAAITKSNDLNQCGAVVSYAPPTTAGDNCGTVVCAPPSGSFFSKGTTTVNCDASGTTANPDCSFTVTVNDTQPPTISCPANVTAVSAVACPPTTSMLVATYVTPTATDNCPGTVTVVCTPPSGSTFPVGTTTVTCTATDASMNTAICTFSVNVFNGRLQDDSNPKNVLLFDTTTGDYTLCCGGTLYTGKGTALLKGCVFTLQHGAADRRLVVTVDFSVKRGTASLQFPPGVVKCTITDRNMADDTSTCP